jgi:spore maturation protein CgeB
LTESRNKGRLLYVGDLAPGTTSRMRCECLRELGFVVSECATDAAQPRGVLKYARKVANRLRLPLDLVGANTAILQHAAAIDVLWLDKANTVLPTTLHQARKLSPRLMIIGYSPDDMLQPHCSSYYFHAGLKWYDAFITTKSFGVPELSAAGCRRVVFSPNAYDPGTHRPPLDPMDCPKPITVGFIGHYEEARCSSIRRLCEEGIPVTASGPGWPEHRRRLPANATCLPAASGIDYATRIHKTLVNLGFLRKMNRDLQTQRSVEIPACAGFLLAERTSEHLELFAEGVEADFFGSDDELVEKVRHYLANPTECRRIGVRGLERCHRDRYSYRERLADALATAGWVKHQSTTTPPIGVVDRP